MDQYSIHIHGNSGSVNIEFVEKAYKLASGEVLVGQENDFPTKVDISDLISMNGNIVSGHLFKSSDFTIDTDHFAEFDLLAYIEDAYNLERSSDNLGLSFVVDLYYTFNHLYLGEESTYHYAGTLHKRITFSIYRTKVSGNDFIFTPINVVHEQGKWVNYNSVGTPYSAIAATGNLSSGAFPVSITQTTSPETLKLKLENALDSETGFSSTPVYETKVKMKLSVFELSQDDYTLEYES